MTKYLFFISIFLIFLSVRSFAQNAANSYNQFVGQADSLLQLGQYSSAATAYSTAFKSIGWRGYTPDRFNAARAWAMSGVLDSAFFNLFRIAEKANYDDIAQLTSELDLQPLYKDARWDSLCIKVKANMPTMPVLATELAQINTLDQQYRMMEDEVSSKHGRESKEVRTLWDTIHYHDSINLIRVKQILDTQGWLSEKEVGATGNSTLFLVIQHSNLPVQEQYLPMMRAAVAAGKAKGSYLALLEDRVALGQGKKQIYGSQIVIENATGKYYISPLEDPKNVDKRRAAVGLGPLNEYVSNWDLIWNDAEAEKMAQQK